MKLIYSGKILGDDDVVSKLSIKENEFVVVMAKPASKAAPKQEKPVPAGASTDSNEATPASATASTPANNATAQASNPAASPSVDAAPSVGTQDQIDQIVGMGFTAEQAAQALRAAFGNSARAVEYLMNPGSMPSDAAAQAASTPANNSDSVPAATTATTGGNAPASDGEPPGELAASSPLYPLLQNGPFVQLRHFVQRQPQLLPALLQELVREQPELVRMINDNREDFYRLLNTPVDAGGGGGGGGPPGQHQIRVTPEEAAAIDRLVMITGQSKGVVVEAYFACDKNEELAANYLLNNASWD